MVSTVSPNARDTPRKPMPSAGNAAARMALPHPPNVNQKVPANSAVKRFCTIDSIAFQTPRPCSKGVAIAVTTGCGRSWVTVATGVKATCKICLVLVARDTLPKPPDRQAIADQRQRRQHAARRADPGEAEVAADPTAHQRAAADADVVDTGEHRHGHVGGVRREHQDFG